MVCTNLNQFKNFALLCNLALVLVVSLSLNLFTPAAHALTSGYVINLDYTDIGAGDPGVNSGNPLFAGPSVTTGSHNSLWYDKSVSGVNDMTLNNFAVNPWVSTGNNGGALKFDGNNNNLTLNIANESNFDFITGNGTFSIEFWFRTPTANVDIMGKVSAGPIGPSVFIESNGMVALSIDNGGSSYQLVTDPLSNSSYADNKWHHAVIVFSPSTKKIYVDNIDRATTTSGTPPAIGNDATLVVGYNGSGGVYYPGELAVFRIYNTALSAVQVTDNWDDDQTILDSGLVLNQGETVTAPTTSGLLAYYDWRNVTGAAQGSEVFAKSSLTTTTWTDLTGNGNNGTLNSFSLPHSGSSGWFQNATNGYLDFDGTNDNIVIANESNFDFDRNSDFTFEFWIKTSSTNKGIIDKRNGQVGYRIFIDNDGYPNLALHDGTSEILINADTNIANNRWHHVAFAIQNLDEMDSPLAWDVPVENIAIIYVDGAQQGQTINNALPAGSILNNSSLIIGDSGGSAFAGQLGMFRVYNRALNTREITTNYKGLNRWFTGTDPTPVEMTALTINGNAQNIDFQSGSIFLSPGDSMIASFSASDSLNAGTLTISGTPAVGTLDVTTGTPGTATYTLTSQETAGFNASNMYGAATTAMNLEVVNNTTSQTADGDYSLNVMAIAPGVPTISSATVGGQNTGTSGTYTINSGDVLALNFSSDGPVSNFMGQNSSVVLSTPSAPSVGSFIAAAAADPGTATYTFTALEAHQGSTYNFSVRGTDVISPALISHGDLSLSITVANPNSTPTPVFVPAPTLPTPPRPNINEGIDEIVETNSNLSGTASGANSVEITLGGEVVANVETDSEGQWELTLSDEILDLLSTGENSLEVKSKNNLGISSDARDVSLFKVEEALEDTKTFPSITTELASSVCQNKGNLTSQDTILAGSLIAFALDKDETTKLLFDDLGDGKTYRADIRDLGNVKHSIGLDMDLLSEEKLFIKSTEIVPLSTADGPAELFIYIDSKPRLEIKVDLINDGLEHPDLPIIESIESSRNNRGRIILSVKGENLNSIKQDLTIKQRKLDEKDCNLPLLAVGSKNTKLKRIELTQTGDEIKAFYKIQGGKSELTEALSFGLVIGNPDGLVVDKIKLEECKKAKCRSKHKKKARDENPTDLELEKTILLYQ